MACNDPGYGVLVEDVRNGFPTSAADFDIRSLIKWADRADGCLEGAGVEWEVGALLKIYAVRHALSMTANGGMGQVTQQSSASGASRSFRAFDGTKLGSTPAGAMLEEMDTSGCVSGLFSGSPSMFMCSVGPRR